MLLGAISDTHLSLADRKFKALLAGELGGAEMLLHAGDHAAEEVADYLEFEEPRPCHSVAGNMDPPALLARLGAKKIIEVGGLRVGLVHGWGAGEGLWARVLQAFPVPPDVIVFGHSHAALVKRVGPTLLVNPGSAYLPRDGTRGTVALIEIGGGGAEARIVEV